MSKAPYPARRGGFALGHLLGASEWWSVATYSVLVAGVAICWTVEGHLRKRAAAIYGDYLVLAAKRDLPVAEDD